jgi:Mg-chelatase subunit ChlD
VRTDANADASTDEDSRTSDSDPSTRDAPPANDAPLRDAAPTNDAAATDGPDSPDAGNTVETTDTADASVTEAPSADVADARGGSDAKIPDGGFRYPNPDGNLCGSARHTLAKSAAEVVIVLDRSASMSEYTAPPRTRWDDARDSVYAAVLANQNLAWGLKLFPTGMFPTAPPCFVDPKVEVPAEFGSGPALQAAIEPAGPPLGKLGAGTPTSHAVKAATAHLKAVTTSLPKFLLLVTDGEPGCPDDNEPADTINAIADAAAAGFKTFVVGIGFTGPGSMPTQIAILNQMADAGGKPRAGDPRFYPAANRGELDAALATIILATTTCVFPLATRPLDPDFVSVTVGGTIIPRDLGHAQGWDYAGNGAAIEIYGSTCDVLKTSQTPKVGIYFGCPEMK